MSVSRAEGEGDKHQEGEVYDEEGIKADNNEVIDIGLNQANGLQPMNDVKCLYNEQCLRAATAKCGKCDNQVCDLHIGLYSKRYTVICKECNDRKLSDQYDESNKIQKKCKRILCSKFIIILVMIIAVLLFLWLYL